jgi:hypothetical protein
MTLMDVLGVGAGTAMVLGMLAMVTLARARESARTIACGANLRGITQSMTLYSVDNVDVFPSLGDAKAYDAAADAYDTPKGIFDKGAGCNIQHYWLLVEQNLVTEDTFRCPSDFSSVPVRRKQEGTLGFPKWRNVSYGLQLTSRCEKNAAYPGAENQATATIVGADKCGADGMDPTREWSANHYGRGTNVASLLGAVNFYTAKDNRAGWQQNNVYEIDVSAEGEVAETGKTTGWPAHESDSFCYWADNDKPQQP